MAAPQVQAMTAPLTESGALFVKASPFSQGGFVPDSDLGVSANILVENSRKRVLPEGEPGKPGEPEGKPPSRHAMLTERIKEELAKRRKANGSEEIAIAASAAKIVASDLEGNGLEWENLDGATWDDDENGESILHIGASSFPQYIMNCYGIPLAA